MNAFPFTLIPNLAMMGKQVSAEATNIQLLVKFAFSAVFHHAG